MAKSASKSRKVTLNGVTRAMHRLLLPRSGRVLRGQVVLGSKNFCRGHWSAWNSGSRTKKTFVCEHTWASLYAGYTIRHALSPVCLTSMRSFFIGLANLLSLLFRVLLPDRELTLGLESRGRNRAKQQVKRNKSPPRKGRKERRKKTGKRDDHIVHARKSVKRSACVLCVSRST